jgi:hypothetical protein
MTNSFPPDPQRQRENNDERIAVFVALAVIGTVLFWGMTRGGDRMNLARLNPLADADVDMSDDRQSELGTLAEDDIIIDMPTVDRRDTEAIAEPFAGLSIFNPFQSDDEEAVPREIRGLGEPRSTLQEPSVQTDTDAELQQNQSTAELSEPLTPNDTAAVPSPDDTANSADAEAELDAEVDSEATSQEETAAEEENLPPAIAFPDVAEDYWAKPFIDRLSQRGIVGGFDDGSFQPDSVLTRAQFAANLKQAFGNGGDGASVNYVDVAPEYWAEESIRTATATGFMSGYPEQDFRPENPVTRLEAIVALVTGLNLSTPDNPEAVLQVYGDRSDIPEWAIEKVSAATEAGIVVSYPNTELFNPNEPITRAETSVLLYQALASQGTVPDMSSEYIVKPN